MNLQQDEQAGHSMRAEAAEEPISGDARQLRHYQEALRREKEGWNRSLFARIKRWVAWQPWHA
jgi:hypothetical protein